MKKCMFILAALLAFTGLIACGSSADNTAASPSAPSSGEDFSEASSAIVTTDAQSVPEKHLNIVTTIFPEYDWVREILGDNAGNADLTMLLDNGVDLHSYQPTAQDILKISTCDLFIYVGGESDGWVSDALQEAANKDMKVIDLLDVLDDAVKEEEIVEGMEAGEEHGDGEDEEHEEEEEGPEYDEHVWLSLRNAKVLCEAITNALTEIDPDHAADYRSNLTSYSEKLDALDAAYQSAIDSASRKTLLFGDRFPFRYLVDDYGLSYYAAFAGCSAETEASFRTITFLSDKADELNLTSVLTIESSDQKMWGEHQHYNSDKVVELAVKLAEQLEERN